MLLEESLSVHHQSFKFRRCILNMHFGGPMTPVTWDIMRKLFLAGVVGERACPIVHVL